MGKGDIRSKRGKIWRGTNGKTRPKRRKKGAPVPGDTSKPEVSETSKPSEVSEPSELSEE